MNGRIRQSVKALLLVCVPALALAGVRNDYVREWPLTTTRTDAGAYRVVLNEAIYQQVQSPGLRDLEVFDAQGNAVPAMVFGAEDAKAKAAQVQRLPWFTLPAMTDAATRDIAAISEIATDGSLRRVQLRGAESAADGGILLDASQLRQAPVALRVSWAAGQAPFDRAYQVLASDNLKDWQVVQERAHLVDLENQGQRVMRDRIELTPLKARYLRLMPLSQAAPLRLEQVSAEWIPARAEPAWAWQTLPATPVQGTDGVMRYEFTLPGRFPVERADVLSSGNTTQTWTLESRDDPAQPWQRVLPPWVAYRLQSGQRTDVSPPQVLTQLHRNRHWLLTPSQPVTTDAPQLRLGYQPEVMVFVAQGQAPFTLAAGSVRTQRQEAPLGDLLAVMRKQRGADWQPALATVGATAQVLAGATALQVPTPPRDWKTWLLWGLLVLGVLLVMGFALSLLRKTPPPA